MVVSKLKKILAKRKVDKIKRKKDERDYKAKIRKIETQKVKKQYQKHKNNFLKIKKIKNSYEKKIKLNRLYDNIEKDIYERAFDYRIDRNIIVSMRNLRTKIYRLL